MEEDSGLSVNRHIKVYWPSTLFKAYLSYYTFYFCPRGVYRNHCLFVLLSVQIHVRLTLTYHIWTWVYHHEKMCRVQHWSLISKVKFVTFLKYSCPPGNFCLLWHCISYLAHGSFTLRLCLDPNTTLSFDLTVKFIGFLTRLCVRPVTWIDLNWIELNFI